MPEGPEVEKIRQRLLSSLNLNITRIQFASGARIQQSLEKHVSTLIGQSIQEITRHGKYLVFTLDKGWLLSHLRMTGGWSLLPESHRETSSFPRFWRVRFTLENDVVLVFTDVRQLGILEYHQRNPLTSDKRLLALGPDVNDPHLVHKLQRLLDERKRWKRRKIADLLVDQRFVAGIGNIYRSEILHAARVHPFRTVNSLTSKELTALFEAIRLVMKRAFQVKSQEIYPFEVGKGPSRLKQDYFQVYGREGGVCPLCQDALIDRMNWKGRSIYYCPNCQKEMME